MKKLFTVLLVTLALLTIAVSCAQDVTVDESVSRSYTGDTFMVNGKYYGTFEEAIKALKGSKAIGDNDGVVYLLKNAAGPGAVINGMDVTIDFQGFTYDFTNVNALIDGTPEQTFGLKITGQSNVNLKGMEKISLYDETAKLTMIYIEDSNVILADAPKLQVEDDQYVFWVADGATLTIGTTVTTSKTNVTGGIKLEGASNVNVEDSEVEIKNMVVEGTDVLVSIDESATVTTNNVDVAKAINDYNTGSGTVAPEVLGHTHASTGTKAKQIDGQWYTVTICDTCGAEMSKTALVFDGQARIDAVGFDTLNAAIGAARNGQTITLLKNIEHSSDSYNSAYCINKSITLDGNGKVITGTGGKRGTTENRPHLYITGSSASNVDVVIKDIKIENTSSSTGNVTARARGIETRGNIDSVTLDNVTLISADQPLTIGGNQATTATITIKNSSIEATSYYPIVTFNPVDMKIDDTTLEGYCCFNLLGPSSSAGTRGSVITVKDSTLISKNGNSGVSNDYGTVVFSDSDITTKFYGCTFRTERTGDAMQATILISEWNSENKNDTVYISSDCVFENPYKPTTPLYVSSGGQVTLQSDADLGATGKIFEGLVFTKHGDVYTCTIGETDTSAYLAVMIMPSYSMQYYGLAISQDDLVEYLDNGYYVMTKSNTPYVPDLYEWVSSDTVQVGAKPLSEYPISAGEYELVLVQQSV